MNPSKWFHSWSQYESTSASTQKNYSNPEVRSVIQERPTVIEVFQSQGCNSCPPTNSLLLSKMAQEDPSLLILDYHVTYWDYLGWKDPFGVREADEYQRQYAHARGTSRVYTPQVVVNGVVEGVGNSKSNLEKLMVGGERETKQRSPWLTFSQTEDGVLITESNTPASSTHGAGRVIEVLYDPMAHDVYIPRGENSGRTLTQRNTVRSVRILGSWNRGQGPIQLPRRDSSDGLRRVLIVQDGVGGPIIGICHISS